MCSDEKVANRNVRGFGWEIAHGGCFATPADFPRLDGTPKRGLRVRRWGLGFVHHSRTIFCCAVPKELRFATFPSLYHLFRLLRLLLLLLLRQAKTAAVAVSASASACASHCYTPPALDPPDPPPPRTLPHAVAVWGSQPWEASSE